MSILAELGLELLRRFFTHLLILKNRNIPLPEDSILLSLLTNKMVAGIFNSSSKALQGCANCYNNRFHVDISNLQTL